MRAAARIYRTGDRGRWLVERHARTSRAASTSRSRCAVIASSSARSKPTCSRCRPWRARWPWRAKTGRATCAWWPTSWRNPAANCTEAALRAHLSKILPEYFVPQHFLVLPQIPLLPNGKVDRKALPAPEAPQAACANSRRRATTWRKPWPTSSRDVLGLPGIGIDDDFFALGGHSLLAAQLTARINRELKVKLSLRTLFDAPTVARLAEKIQAELAAGTADQRSAHREPCRTAQGAAVHHAGAPVVPGAAASRTRGLQHAVGASPAWPPRPRDVRARVRRDGASPAFACEPASLVENGAAHAAHQRQRAARRSRPKISRRCPTSQREAQLLMERLEHAHQRAVRSDEAAAVPRAAVQAVRRRARAAVRATSHDLGRLVVRPLLRRAGAGVRGIPRRPSEPARAAAHQLRRFRRLASPVARGPRLREADRLLARAPRRCRRGLRVAGRQAAPSRHVG